MKAVRVVKFGEVFLSKGARKDFVLFKYDVITKVLCWESILNATFVDAVAYGTTINSSYLHGRDSGFFFFFFFWECYIGSVPKSSIDFPLVGYWASFCELAMLINCDAHKIGTLASPHQVTIVFIIKYAVIFSSFLYCRFAVVSMHIALCTFCWCTVCVYYGNKLFHAIVCFSCHVCYIYWQNTLI